MNTLCSNCKKEIASEDIFCPHCGHKTDRPGTVLTSPQRIKIYLASFFLSPFGLIWFFKYFRDENPENKKVGYAALVITLLPLILTMIIGARYIKSFSTIINTYETNLDAYSELGL